MSDIRAAMVLHANMDLVQRESRLGLDVEVTCDAGCNWCCYLPVAITNDEANLLHFVIQKKGISLDVSRLSKQTNWGMNAETWGSHDWEDCKCGLLGDDGKCSVYEYRPLSCRNLITSCSQEACKAHMGRGATPDRSFKALTNEPMNAIMKSAMEKGKVFLSNALLTMTNQQVKGEVA